MKDHVDVPGLFSAEVPVLTLDEGGRERLQDHIRRSEPAVIANLAAAWPALQRWTPERLSEKYGDKIVRVYDASFGTPGKNYMGSVDSMPFSQFLEEVLVAGRDLRMFLYNIGRQIPEMLEDIDFPDIGLQFSKRFVYTFFGCQHATTPLHYDIDMGYVLHTAIRGRRRIRLFPPNQSAALYQHPFTVRSYVDLDDPDFVAYPALRYAQGNEFILEPGQTLFMPAGYWHEFHYLDAGYGLSLRAGSPHIGDRAKGIGNILALSPIDRVGNKISQSRWFDWKKRRADKQAHQYMSTQEKL